jgi:alpha-L-arabinofuranosidase
MTSASPDDENSFENPEKVAPRRTLLHHLGTAFEYLCPPTSISIVKVKITKSSNASMERQ